MCALLQLTDAPDHVAKLLDVAVPEPLQLWGIHVLDRRVNRGHGRDELRIVRSVPAGANSPDH